MNFSCINQITSEQYGFPVYHEGNHVALNGIPGKKILYVVKESLATNVSYETIAERLNRLWESNQQRMIGGRFYEAEGVYVTGPIYSAEIHIFGREKNLSVAEDELDNDIDDITGLYGDMGIDVQ